MGFQVHGEHIPSPKPAYKVHIKNNRWIGKVEGNGGFAPWNPSQVDMFAVDWIVF